MAGTGSGAMGGAGIVAGTGVGAVGGTGFAAGTGGGALGSTGLVAGTGGEAVAGIDGGAVAGTGGGAVVGLCNAGEFLLSSNDVVTEYWGAQYPSLLCGDRIETAFLFWSMYAGFVAPEILVVDFCPQRFNFLRKISINTSPRMSATAIRTTITISTILVLEAESQYGGAQPSWHRHCSSWSQTPCPGQRSEQFAERKALFTLTHFPV